MIRVSPTEPPPDFHEKVEKRGKEWLSTHNEKQKLPRLWDRYRQPLYIQYRGICAYTGLRIHELGMSLDHFLPTSKFRDLAFTWSNYRLTSSSINSRKGDRTGILDPFEIPDRAFLLRLDTGHVSINEAAFSGNEQIEKARKLLEILPMNIIKNTYMQLIDDFMHKHISEKKLSEDAPFLYEELRRQHIIKQ